jgi:NADH-quinone oxidoreductase subunit D
MATTETVTTDQLMRVSVGPQHPGSGHFRFIVTLDGDYIIDVEPDPGYVHRGCEKMAEYRNWFQNIPHLERPVIHDSSNILYPYCLAYEELLGIEAPERGRYMRMIMAELNRIISHLYYLGIYGVFTGHTTMFMWPKADREPFIDLALMCGGQRVTFAYLIPGGVRNDMPAVFKERAEKVFTWFLEQRLPEYDRIFFENPIFEERTRGVGVLSREKAVELGAVGPTARASGVDIDMRRDKPYDFYDRVDFDVPVFKEGDSYARALVHREEIVQSIKIIRQCLKQMPEGPVRAVMRGRVRLQEGEVLARTEASRGEMTYYIVSKGGDYPYRLRLVTPSYRNLPAMRVVLKGMKLGDMPVAYWSLDYWPVEADR